MSEALPDEIARFVADAPIAVTLAPPEGPNRPLLAASRGFCAMVGYSEREVLGRDCRFLQGEATTAESRLAMRRFFADADASQERFALVNYRADRRPFINMVFLSKLCGSSGDLRFLLASQFDAAHADREQAEAYDRQLGAGFSGLGSLAKAHNLTLKTSFAALAASTHAIAGARLALAELEAGGA